MTNFRHSYRLDSWKGWDHQIHFSAVDFKNAFGIYPNLLEANEATYARLDVYADRKKIKGAAGEKIGPHEYVKLGGFVTASGSYTLEFFLDHKLPDKFYILALDAEPGEKEPLPEEFESVRIAIGG